MQSSSEGNTCCSTNNNSTFVRNTNSAPQVVWMDKNTSANPFVLGQIDSESSGLLYLQAGWWLVYLEHQAVAVVQRKATITMRFLSGIVAGSASILACISLLASSASAYSLDDRVLRKQLGQKSIVDQTLWMASTACSTRRETIRMMTNQTPMVPYKVCDCVRRLWNSLLVRMID